MDQIERRQFPRLPVNVDVRYAPAAEGRPAGLGLADARDLSAGGISIIMQHRPRLHESLRLSLTLPDSYKPLTATGQVVRIDEIRIGDEMTFAVAIAFTDIEDRQRDRISEFLGQSG